MHIHGKYPVPKMMLKTLLISLFVCNLNEFENVHEMFGKQFYVTHSNQYPGNKTDF